MITRLNRQDKLNAYSRMLKVCLYMMMIVCSDADGQIFSAGLVDQYILICFLLLLQYYTKF